MKRGFRGACAEPAERHSACKPMRGAQLEVKTSNTCGFTDALSPLPSPPRRGEGATRNLRCLEDGAALSQAASTFGATPNFPAFCTKARSNVMKASSAALELTCSASAKSMPCE